MVRTQPPSRLELLQAKLPLYGRLILFVLMSFWTGGVYLLYVLARRWLRVRQQWPSNTLKDANGSSLEPSLDGLSRRFLALEGHAARTGAAATPAPGAAEAAVESLLRRCTLADGQEIAYWDLGPADAEDVVILVNGLGARLAVWVPLLDALHAQSAEWRQRRVLVPEYRGQFASTPLKGAISVERSARDLSELAISLGVSRAALICYSTGVQVGLQLCLDRPDLVSGLVLVQGLSGEAMDNLLQLPCTVPGMPTLLSLGLDLIPSALLYRGFRGVLHKFLVKNADVLQRVAACITWVFGSDLVAPIAVRYGQDMLQSDAQCKNYFAYARALGNHRTFEQLPQITSPALIITGTPDFITPARCSYDMALCLGGQTELYDDAGGSHWYILEEPQKCASRIIHFLSETAERKLRVY